MMENLFYINFIFSSMNEPYKAYENERETNRRLEKVQMKYKNNSNPRFFTFSTFHRLFILCFLCLVFY